MKKIVFVVCCILFTGISYSQDASSRQQKKEERRERINELIAQEEEGALIFHKQTIFGAKLNSDGYGAFLEWGRSKTSRKSNLYGIELGERKHNKEERIPTQAGYLSNPYIYGKINNFYYAKVGFAQQRLIGNKGNKNGVAVSAIYGGGLTAGLLKPYYIKVVDPQSNQVKDVKYKSSGDDQVFLNNPSLILGASGFTKGFGEVKFTPGAYLKTAIRFDYGRYNEMISALEVGLGLEAYGKKMPHMLLNNDRQLFFNAYAAIMFGKRK